MKQEDPLSAVIDYWLKGNRTEPVIFVSWKSIVGALEADSVGETGLADEIRKTIANMKTARLEKVRNCVHLAR